MNDKNDNCNQNNKTCAVGNNDIAESAKTGSDTTVTTENVVDGHTADASKNKSVGKRSVSYLAKISILSAIAVVLLYIEFPLFPATPWLKLNVSDVPTLLASFMFGPLSGALVNAVKVGVCLLLRGTSTGFVGDFSNLISGTIYAIAAGTTYLLKKDKLGAILSLILGSVLFCLSMWACNMFLLLPWYGISDWNAMMPLLWWTLLFNVVKTLLTSLLTFFLYKGTHRLFLRF